MVTTLSRPKTQDVQIMAESIREKALEYAFERYARYIQDPVLDELLYRHDFVEAFKSGVAEEVAGVLSSHDGHVQAVYLFDPDANPGSEDGVYLPVDGVVHLLVQVDVTSAALKSFLVALDRGLTQSFAELPAGLYADYTSVLDVILVTEEEVKQRKGYACLLSSIFAPPLKVWQR